MSTQPSRAIQTVQVSGPDGPVTIAAGAILDAMTAAQFAETRNQVTQSHLAGEAPVYRCGSCHGPVFVTRRGEGDGSNNARLHFVHYATGEPCEWRSGASKVVNIGGRKFDGRQEGEAHWNFKHRVAEAMACDKRISKIVLEKRIYGNESWWRQPDVSGLFGTRQLAFDLQLATAEIRTISGRNTFYEQNGIAHVWVVAPSVIDQLERQGFQDLYLKAGGSIACLTSAAMAMSRETAEMHLTNLRLIPRLGDHTIFCVWETDHVPIDALIGPIGNRAAVGMAHFGKRLQEQLPSEARHAIQQIRELVRGTPALADFAGEWAVVSKTAHGRSVEKAAGDDVHLAMQLLRAVEALLTAPNDAVRATCTDQVNRRLGLLIAARTAASWASLVEFLLRAEPELKAALVREHVTRLRHLQRYATRFHLVEMHARMLAVIFQRWAFGLLAQPPRHAPTLRG